MSDDVPLNPKAAPRRLPIAVLAVVAFLAVPAYGFYYWGLSRIEVPPQKIAILIQKTGDDLAKGHVMARTANEKGIQLAILKPGRHFRNPLFWEHELHSYHSVPQGQIGVLIRQYGETPDLSQNLLVPKDPDEQGRVFKGIVREVLKPGDYPINPYAYHVENHKAIEIKAGFVGVICNRVGRTPKIPNTYLVDVGERGVQRRVKRQGAHYLNPYEFEVFAVDIRSQRLEFTDKTEKGEDGALHFPSSDGFEIEVHLTTEWSIDPERAAEVFVRIGTGKADPEHLLQDILNKTLVPAIRGIARIKGSQYPAANYISGETRTTFQTEIFKSLKTAVGKQGILIRSVLVNDIVPPDAIAAPIRAREVAKEELQRNKVQAGQAVTEQGNARKAELVKQGTAQVLAGTETKKRVIKAKIQQKVALIEQAKLLLVAEADLAAAKLQAEAIRARGKAEAAVVVAQNEAEAKPLQTSVNAFETPGAFSSYVFAQRIAPAIGSVFASPEGTFGKLFEDLIDSTRSKSAKGGAK
ncbi:MAG: hypothetical protein JKY65_16420 [Planctomycetes bacterium]|nr:hypothetical protein [Planctomycetota bacterium]